MSASDSTSVMAMLKEMRDNMMTAAAAEQAHKQPRVDLEQSIATAVNTAVETHVQPLIARQRQVEEKFNELLKRMERLEIEHNAMSKREEEPHAKRACSADRGQASSSEGFASRPQRRHMPEHATTNPVSDRTLRLTGFRRHLTPKEMAEFVKPLLGNTAYEKITSARPRGGEARVIFKTKAERDTFKTIAVTGTNPMGRTPSERQGRPLGRPRCCMNLWVRESFRHSHHRRRACWVCSLRCLCRIAGRPVSSVGTPGSFSASTRFA